MIFHNETREIRERGFIYQNTNNTLSAYMISTGKYYILSNKWENLTYDTSNRIFWASRQDIFYTELNNGTLSSITDYGVINGHFYVQVYFPLNNTYKLSNTTLSVPDISKYGENYSSRSPYEWNIYPLSLNGTYLIDFSVGVQVNHGLFVWSIFGGRNGHMIAFNIGGIGLASASGQSSMTEYSFQGQIASQREITFDYFNWTTDKFVVMARSMHDGDATTCNNQPYYITPLPDGNYKITLYQDLNDSSTYWLWHFYYNSKTHNLSSVYINARNLHVDDMETAANQEVLVSDYGFITGITDSLTYIKGYYNLYSPYISYERLAAYRSTNPWFNSLFHKTGNPLINVLVAGYNNSVMYVWNSNKEHPDLPAKPAEFIVYSMRTAQVHFTVDNLIPYTQWKLLINGSTETHLIAGNNFTVLLPNCTYSFIADDSANVAYGSFTVNGKYVDIIIKFPRTFTVDFRESGLPEHSKYSVSVNNNIIWSNNVSLNYRISNGTYHYTVATSNKNYSPDIQEGTLKVNGHFILIHIVFMRLYKVEFIQNGLPPGTVWYLNFSNGASYRSSNNTIILKLKNGTYDYTISTAQGYITKTPQGILKVDGSGSNIHIEVVKTKSDFPQEYRYIMLGIVIGISVGIISLLMVKYKRIKK
jgi:hypothetical protein